MKSVKDIFKAIGHFTESNAPAILTGISVAGVMSTTVLTVVATVKTMNDISEADPNSEMTKKEAFKLVWPNYIPVVISAGITIAASVSAQHVNSKRQVALATAYELADNALKTYKEEVIEQIGKNKEKKIQKVVDQKDILKKPPTKEFVGTLTDNDVVFKDPMTGQYFKSNIDKVKMAARKANEAMLHDRVELNEFIFDCGGVYSEIGHDYFFDYYETGEIYVDDLLSYNEEEIHGHTFVIATMHYTCKNRYR